MLFRYLANQNHHQFAGTRGTYNHVAEHSFLRTEIDERVGVLVGVIADRIADTVRDIILQPALFDGEHLVECSRNVESHRVHLVIFDVLFHFFRCQPAFVREGELQFVPVKLCFSRSQDRRDFRQFDLSDTAEVVFHLFLFVFDLFCVGQYLPFTPAAYAIVLAKRNGTYR